MNGILLFHIHLHGHFGLNQNCWYQFPFEGKRTCLLINKIETSLLIHDLFNELEKSQVSISPKNNPLEIRGTDGVDILLGINGSQESFTKPLSTILQFGQHYQRILTEKYITEIIGAVEFSELGEIAGENNKRKRDELIKKVLNFFIYKYNQSSRISSVALINNGRGHYGDFLIPRNAILEYGKDIKDFDEIFKNEISYSLNVDLELINTPLTPISFDNKFVKECTENFSKSLLRNISLEHELLSNALEQFGYSKNYKFALLEAFIAAEAVIGKSLHQLKLKKGISNNKLSNYKKEVPVSHKIVELRKLLDNLTKSEIKIIDNVDLIRDKRNQVVHRAGEVTFEEAKLAINSVYDLVGMFENRQLI